MIRKLRESNKRDLLVISLTRLIGQINIRRLYNCIKRWERRTLNVWHSTLAYIDNSYALFKCLYTEMWGSTNLQHVLMPRYKDNYTKHNCIDIRNSSSYLCLLIQTEN